MKVFIGYSNRLFSDGIEAILNGIDDFEVIHSSNLDDSLLNQSGMMEEADVLILECDYPRRPELNLIHGLLKRFTGLNIFLLSYQPGLQYGMELLNSGIVAYILKTCSKSDLLSALNKIADHKNYFCSEITRELVAASKKVENERDQVLTEREIEILGLLVNCHSSGEIANRLQISENTVKTHKRNVQAKIGTANILDMFMYALKNNIVDIANTDLCSSCPYFSEN